MQSENRKIKELYWENVSPNKNFKKHIYERHTFLLPHLPPCGVPRYMGQAGKKRNRFSSIALWWVGIVL